jgi:beta-glucosidase
MLLVRLRRAGEVPKDLKIGVGCGSGCSGLVPFAETLGGVPANQWQVVGIPLKCFAKAGADVSKVNEALALETKGKLDLAFSQVKLGTVADKTLTCN